MSYKTPIKLLDSTYEALQQATIDNSIIRTKHNQDRGGFWPSAASISILTSSPTGRIYEKIEGSCLRQSYYQMLRYKETDFINARTLKVSSLGSAAEDIYKKWFESNPEFRLIYPDILGRKLKFDSLRNGIKLSGEVDIVLEHIETETVMGIEMKTYDGSLTAANLCGPDVAKEVYKAWIPSEYVDERAPFPKIQNLLQTMLYLEEFWDEIKLWKICYSARDKGPDTEFDITLASINNIQVAVVNGKAYPEFNLQGIYKRFSLLQDYVNRKELPPRDYIPEYDPNFLLTGKVSPTFGGDQEASVLAHILWQEALDKKAANKRSKKTKSTIYKEAMASVKSDWQCNYCAFKSTCIRD